MASKSVNSSGLQILSLAFALAPLSITAQTAPLKFAGVESCSTSSCHGGAGEMRHQVDTWTRLDFHSKSAHTLTSARSEQIAKAAGIPDAAKSTRCTTCHAPFHDVPAAVLSANVKTDIGVSCENCHGPAERWLLSHTRKDFSHADKVAAGMRDLRNLNIRANSCVACHQTVETTLLNAGHPELLFELDGQSVTEPRHWKERGDYHGGKAWLVGQAVALRETSWQLSGELNNAALATRWAALVWLLQKTDGLDSSLPSLKAFALVAAAENVKRAQQLADDLAKQAAKANWSGELSLKLLRQLAASHAEFREQVQPQLVQARRAERLVIAFDRLVTSLNRKGLDAELNGLFKLVQSIPDFEPAKFADALEQFSRKLPQTVATK